MDCLESRPLSYIVLQKAIYSHSFYLAFLLMLQRRILECAASLFWVCAAPKTRQSVTFYI